MARIGIFLVLLPVLPMSPKAQELVRFHLGNGRVIVGTVLKRNDGKIWVDLGFDVLRIPGSAVKKEEKVARPKKGNIQKKVEEREIFAYADLPEKSITEGARLVEEGVVKVSGSLGQGSGFIISREGYVVTNFHVVEDQDNLKVTLYIRSKNGYDLKTIEKVKVVAANPHMDLALLKMDVPKGLELTRVFLGNSDTVKVGEKVFAIGNPLGLERTVSEGIVSVANRTFGGRIHFQITAAINPGNSGGPLFNLRGQVIGVTSSKIFGVGIEGLNFAIPVNYVIDFLKHRDAFAVDYTRTKDGIHYLPAPRKPGKKKS